MIIKPPQSIPFSTPYLSCIFLAGTIDNGDSEDWQEKTGKILDRDNILILNPRRNNWNTNASKEEMEEQIRWEYTGLCRADVIIINFLPNSKSPISLLELGLFADTGKCRVVCPKEFYRFDNVEFICNEYHIPLFDNIDELIL